MVKKKDQLPILLLAGGATVGGLILFSQVQAAGEELPQFVGGALTSGLEPFVAPLQELPAQIGTGISQGIATGAGAVLAPVSGAVRSITGGFRDVSEQVQTIADLPSKTVSGITDQVGDLVGRVTEAGQKVVTGATTAGIRGAPVAVPLGILGAAAGPVGAVAGAAAGGIAGNIVFEAGARAGEATRTLFPGFVQGLNQFTGGGLKALSDLSRAIFGG